MKMKTCIACGDDITKKSNESVKVYRNRKYCSVYCAKAYMKKTKSGWFVKYNPNPDINTIDAETYDKIMNRQEYSRQDEYRRLGHEFEAQLIKDLGLDN